MSDLLASGVQLVDRATVMRLLASDIDVAKDSTGMLSVKKIETDALKGKVDIFIEILAIPSIEPGRRYDYRAVAKQLKTGQVIATVTTLGEMGGDYGESVGNISDNTAPRSYTPVKAEETAAWLGLAIKAKLAAYWQASY